MSLERPRGSSSRNRLHHRRLDLHEVERIEIIAQIAQHARAGAKHLAAGLIHHQIDVASAITQLGVGQPVPLIRQRPQRFGQQHQALDPHR
jgi:hypothetical protein